jgi:hypothetical protein
LASVGTIASHGEMVVKAQCSFIAVVIAAMFVGCAPPSEDAESGGQSTPTSTTTTTTVLTPSDWTTNPLPPVEPVYDPLYASQISVGVYHVCALLTDGKLACWGNNNTGALGLGTVGGVYDRPRQSMSNYAGTMTNVDAGERHTCVVRSADGLVSCWGRNAYGQVNPRRQNGQPPTSGCPLGNDCGTASTVSGIAGAVQVSAGYDHTCVRLATRMQCWGKSTDNLLGMDTGGSPSDIGNGGLQLEALDAGEIFSCSQDYRGLTLCRGKTPIPDGWEVGTFPFPPAPTTRVSVGRKHACAIHSDGGPLPIESEVRCLGDSTSGQCGLLTSITDPFPFVAPATVANVEGAIAVAAGARHTCALLNGGDVKCWGANDHGQLGMGEVNDWLPPVTANLPVNAIAIAAGGDTTCALSTAGRPYCWGANGFGQVGTGSSDHNIPTPKRVTWGPAGAP